MEQYSKLIGSELEDVHKLVDRVGPSAATVLIEGESGTGKELVAEALHWRSGRRGKLIRLNCGAIPEGLVDSELFGHDRGAFTGADSGRMGHFEAANGGTLFLDEIGNMPLRLQARLLRVLQNSTITRLGSTAVKVLNVRVVAASNVDLWGMCEAGTFRYDLYYRLSVVKMGLKPLRQRRADIESLAKHFLARLGPRLRLGAGALLALECHDWPGNVRELEHAMQRGVLFEEAGEVVVAGLGLPMSKEVLAATPRMPLGRTTLTQVESYEREAILRSLGVSRGNQAAAAASMGLSPRAMCYKIKKYGIVNPLRRPGGKRAATRGTVESEGMEGAAGGGWEEE